MMQEERMTPELSDRSSEELLREYRETKSLAVKQELAIRYIYIVRNVAIQMRDVYVGFAQLDDIIDEGVIVVMNAIDKFDIDMNVKFETYISKRIRGMIIDLARKQDWVPRTVRKSAKDIDEATMKLYSKNGRMPSSHETAEFLNMPLEKFQKVVGKANLHYVLSLDMLMEENVSENKKSVQIPSLNFNEQPEEHYLSQEFRQILEEGIRSLREKEQLVISLYYVEELSAKEIAKILMVSEPRISQIHANAIRKLKAYIENATRLNAGKEKK